MPAKDRYHDIVIECLLKAGWHIQQEQNFIRLPERRLYIDLLASKLDHEVLIEIKGFENTPSPIDYLASAWGQYMLYQIAISKLQLEKALYMAVPNAAYHGIFSEFIGQALIQDGLIKLLVFDPKKVEIVTWIG